jgi:aldose 1-epimerase
MRRNFGVTPNGEEVHEYILENSNGVQLSVLNYGGIVRSLKVPDRKGILEDVVLGFDTMEDYIDKSPYFGAIVGRYANRIANGSFFLDGKKYSLARNIQNNHLHGGQKGFDKVIWDVTDERFTEGQGLRLTYTSKHMEEGYPGTLEVEVHYILTPENELIIRYKADTDQPTILNLTQHSYFNLNGGKENILDHQLSLTATHYTVVNKELIPTGEIRSVNATPFDFSHPVTIRERMSDEMLLSTDGYDQNLILKLQDNPELIFAGEVREPSSGRILTVHTTEPGVQLFTSNFFDGSMKGKGGTPYTKYYGLCLETQHFPDSPHHPAFPSTVLRPGETYHSETRYGFSVSNNG